MAVYVTGDTHGCKGVLNRLNSCNFYEQKEMKADEENYVIVLGDFGVVWGNNDSKDAKFAFDVEKGEKGEDTNEAYTLDWLKDKPFTVLFVEGNHDNYPRIYTYPVKEWHGGKVHEIRQNVLHLIRGEVYEIEGSKFFAFGGASSHDINDGILDINDFKNYNKFKNAYRDWSNSGKSFRVNNISWWKEELPKASEYGNALENLSKANFKVDYCLSHCAPTFVQSYLDRGFKKDELTDFFQKLYYEDGLTFKAWMFGHYHTNKKLLDKFVCLYEQVVRII